MKNFLYTGIAFLALATTSCATKIPSEKPQDRRTVQAQAQDTVRIANDELEYEVIIIDPGFNSWLAANARPRGYYSQAYLESRNAIWVNEWNIRVGQALRYGDLYQLRIDYNRQIDYGYEVNYLLFNYLVYFQQSNRTSFGGFAARA